MLPMPTPTPWVPTVQIGTTLPIDPAFVDQNGRTFRWHQLSGGGVILAFIYTRCRESNECPATSAKFAAMQHALPRGTRLLEVTLDPANDTPAVLRSYGAMYDEDPNKWTLATGEPEQVLEFARRFNVIVAPARERGQLEHGEALAIFDPQQRLVSLTAGNDWQPDEALAVAEQAAGQPNNPLAALMLWFRNFGTTCGAILASPSGKPIRIAIAAACGIAILAIMIFAYRAVIKNGTV